MPTLFCNGSESKLLNNQEFDDDLKGKVNSSEESCITERKGSAGKGNVTVNLILRCCFNVASRFVNVMYVGQMRSKRHNMTNENSVVTVGKCNGMGERSVVSIQISVRLHITVEIPITVVNVLFL